MPHILYVGLQDDDKIAAFALAELRRFEHFKAPKWLRLLRPTPEDRHYSGIGGTGPAVILGAVERAAPV